MFKTLQLSIYLQDEVFLETFFTIKKKITFISNISSPHPALKGDQISLRVLSFESNKAFILYLLRQPSIKLTDFVLF